jgi:hypothetical protein
LQQGYVTNKISQLFLLAQIIICLRWAPLFVSVTSSSCDKNNVKRTSELFVVVA